MVNHQFHCQVYTEDTDYTGVVYHANYLKFCERARTQFLADHGAHLEQQGVDGTLYVISSATINYHYPARLGDALQIDSAIHMQGKTAMRVDHQVSRQADSRRLASVTVEIVCVNHAIRPRALPQTMQELLNA